MSTLARAARTTAVAMALFATSAVAWAVGNAILPPGTIAPIGDVLAKLGVKIAVHIANNAELGAYRYGGVVHRDGYAIAADGGGASYAHSTSPCSMNAGAGDGGSQIVDVAGTGCWRIDRDAVLTQRTFGVDCTGSTDSTTAVQAMFNAGVATQQWIDLRACIAQTTATITIKGHILVRSMRPQVVQGQTVLADPQTVGPGAWFYFNHTGKGLVLYPPQGAPPAAGNASFSYGNELKGFGMYRNQPKPSPAANVAYTPCACDFDIALVNAEARIDVVDLNPTKGISLYNAGKTNIDVYGQPLGIGVEALANYDNLYFGELHFWPYWSGNSNVFNYTTSNAIGLHTGRADGLHVRDLFCFGCSKGWDVDRYAGNGGYEPSGTAYIASIDRLYADSTNYGLFVEPSSVGAQIQIKEFVSQSPNNPDGSTKGLTSGINVQGSNNTINLGSCFFDYEGAYAISIAGSGTGNRLHCNSALIGKWSNAFGIAAGTYPAFNATIGNSIVIDDYSFTTDVGTSGRSVFGAHSFKGETYYGSPRAAWNVDTTGYTPAPTAAGGTIPLPGGSGPVFLRDSTNGNMCEFLVGGARTALVSQTGRDCATTARPGVVSLTSINGVYTITNGLAAATTIYVYDVRVAPFN